MERLKTYEIWKMIDENKDEMVGKRYVQVSGLLQNGFNLGDIAVVTEYHRITSLGSEKHSKMRLSWNGFEEWEEVKEPVSFMEAIKALDVGKAIYCEIDNRKFTYKRPRTYITEIRSEEAGGISVKEILEGKWYIE